jgi:predicted nucleic-acid-binding Zn-ribbon protein
MKLTCPKCKSERWMTGLNADRVFSYVVVGRTSYGTTSTSNMCADCGYTEFYGKEPKTVWNAWSKQKR